MLPITGGSSSEPTNKK
jgi:hypothetical protein